MSLAANNPFIRFWDRVFKVQNEEDEYSCPICLEPFLKFSGQECGAVWLICGHIYHVKCIFTHQMTPEGEEHNIVERKCPTCRGEIIFRCMVSDGFVTNGVVRRAYQGAAVAGLLTCRSDEYDGRRGLLFVAYMR